MKIFTPSRIAVLSALSAVIVVLLSIILINELSFDQANGTGQPAAATHSRIRDARVGLADNIAWEINFGGSGDEKPVSAFTANGKLYIFGNTSSDDLDFDGSGIFAARLNEFGQTEKFAVLGGDGDTLASASLTAGGFLLAQNGTNQTAMFVDYEFAVTCSTVLPRPEECAYSVCDVGFADNKYYIFRQAEQGNGAFVVCDVLASDGSALSQTVLKQSLSLRYRGFFPYTGRLTVALEELGSSGGCTTFAQLPSTGTQNVVYTRILTNSRVQTLAVYPLGSGWLTLNTGDGETFALVVDSAYVPLRKVYISFPVASRGELFYSNATKSHYAAVYLEGEISGLFNFGSSIVESTAVALPSFGSMRVFSSATSDVLALCGGDKINLAVLTSGGITTTYVTDCAASPIVMRSANNWFLTMAVQKNSAIIGDNYGKYDVAVAKLRF